MPIYSHSKLQSFEQCPLKYKFRYIDKIVPEIKQTIEGFLGNMVHESLEHLYKASMKKITIPLDELIEFYARSWKEKITPEVKIVKEDVSEEFYFNKGIKFLINYYQKHAPFFDNTIETEKKIFVKLDNYGNYKLIGFIDRLVYDKEKNIFEIHDYKTSSSLKSQDELDKDRQLALYSLGIRELFPTAQDVHLIWHYLDFNETIRSFRTLEQLENLKSEIIKLIKKIESTTEFPPHPSILCKWCEFQKNCPVCKETNFCEKVNLKETIENDSNGEYDKKREHQEKLF